eukprot:3598334-Pyramimonas_sp.AAC.1
MVAAAPLYFFLCGNAYVVMRLFESVHGMKIRLRLASRSPRRMYVHSHRARSPRNTRKCARSGGGLEGVRRGSGGGPEGVWRTEASSIAHADLGAALPLHGPGHRSAAPLLQGRKGVGHAPYPQLAK